MRDAEIAAVDRLQAWTTWEMKTSHLLPQLQKIAMGARTLHHNPPQI
jgi:hypothetical protein